MPIFRKPDGTYEQKTYELLPKGKYDAEILAIEPKTSAKGVEMWRVCLGIELNERVVHVYDNVVWTEKAMQRVSHFYKCFGFNEPEDGVECSTLPLIGRKAIAGVMIEPKTYNGKTYNSVPFDGYHTYKEEDLPAAPANPGDTSDIPF